MIHGRIDFLAIDKKQQRPYTTHLVPKSAHLAGSVGDPLPIARIKKKGGGGGGGGAHETDPSLRLGCGQSCHVCS